MIKALLFPAKCILCGKLLKKQETDLCHHCREHTPGCTKANFTISFVARWTALWYYKENVRESLLRYKFRRKQYYCTVYGKMLAIHLQQNGFDQFDILTWVPISLRRRWKRGFDQVELIAKATARDLGCTAYPTLKKIRHTPPQSSLTDVAKRRATYGLNLITINPAAAAEPAIRNSLEKSPLLRKEIIRNVTKNIIAVPKSPIMPRHPRQKAEKPINTHRFFF